MENQSSIHVLFDYSHNYTFYFKLAQLNIVQSIVVTIKP